MPPEPRTHPFVSIKALSHRYTDDWAVKNFDFEIETTGVVGLLGANGAGKSTFMNILCGVLRPTRGDVVIGGKSMRNSPIAAKSQLGFLPQQLPLYPEFTVEEFLTYAAGLRAVPKAKVPESVKVCKEQCGLAGHSTRLIGALSGGYRQRLGIAQAVIHQPSLVVLDEPTNGLDPNQILAVRDLIRDISKNSAVLISTHVLSEVAALCNEVKMIDNGEIVFEGSVEEFASVVESQNLVVVFDDPPAEAEFLKLEGIGSIKYLSSKKLRIHPQSQGERLVKDIVAASVAGDWGLRELYVERTTLEEAFASLSVGSSS